jgi:hypothetical protein
MQEPALLDQILRYIGIQAQQPLMDAVQEMDNLVEAQHPEHVPRWCHNNPISLYHRDDQAGPELQEQRREFLADLQKKRYYNFRLLLLRRVPTVTTLPNGMPNLAGRRQRGQERQHAEKRQAFGSRFVEGVHGFANYRERRSTSAAHSKCPMGS